MADITIRHDHEGGTRVEGSEKGDGVYEILRALGWTWRSYAGIHIRASRDKLSNPHRIAAAATALRAAGHTVTVEVDDTFRPAEVREEERAERVEARVDRYSGYSDSAATRSTAARDASRAITDGRPFGQPMMPDHYSYRADVRRQDRVHSLEGRRFAEADKAEHWANRAAGAAANEAHKQDPRAIMRRIETLEVEARRIARSLEGATGQWAERLQLRAVAVKEEIAHLRGKLDAHAETGTFVAWAPEHFRKGDHVNVGGRWCEVARINTKSVSVLGRWHWSTASDRAVPVKWDEIHGRRRDGYQIDSPQGEPWPVELAKQVARWASLKRMEGCQPHDDDSRRQRMHVAWAQRLVHGFDLGAADAELGAVQVGLLSDVATRRDLAARYLAVYDRLEAGERAPDIAATLMVEPGSPAWRIPTGREPEDRRAGPTGWRNDTQPLVQPGDLVRGIYDRGFAGSGRRLLRGFCGPVASVSAVNNRREAGEWVTIRLADGTEREMQTHMWLAVYPAGTWEDTDRLTVVSGPHRPTRTVNHCDVGGEALPDDMAWWLVQHPGRGWTANRGAACAEHAGQQPVHVPAADPAPRDGTARAMEALAERRGE
jgi:hypothetical protein